jgi:Rrf2 family iron-sulfur cluster assembly transcriptional regulator
MLTLTGEYALRAMIYLAQHTDDWPISSNRIAEQAGVPAKYLSRILGDLVRAGVLDSLRGRGGGFQMIRSPVQVSLYDVLAPFEESKRPRRCPFGNALCNEADPCLAHHRWKKVQEARQRFLQTTSLYSVAVKRSDHTKHLGKRRPRKTKR